MRSTRSGARSRVLPFSAPHYIGSESLVFNVLFGLLVPFVLCALLLAAHLPAVRDFLGGRDPLHRLLRPLDPAETALGAVHLGGRMLGARGDVPPLCHVVHQHYVSGKNGGWRNDWSRDFNQQAELDTTRGRLPVVGEGFRFEPALLRPGDAHEAAWRASGETPAGGRFREQCVGLGQAVFVDGCLYGSPSAGVQGLAGCGGSALVLTPGDGTPQRRIDHLAADLAGSGAALAVPLVCLLLYGWLLVRARPLAGALLALAREAPAKAPPSVYVGLALLPVMAFLAWLMVQLAATPDSWADVPRGGYVWVALVAAASLVLLVRVRDRLRALRAAAAPVIDAPTTPLAQAGRGVVEVAARVRADAPVSVGPLSDRPHAFWAVTVYDVYRSGKNLASAKVQDQPGMALVSIEDASGHGLLDLSGAAMDVRAVRQVVRGAAWSAASRRVLERIVPTLSPMPGHVAWVVEERFLDPGEQLYLLGEVERRVFNEHQWNYRADPSTPVLGSGAGRPLIAYAGTERSLLAALALERSYLRVVGVAALGVPLALAVAAACLAAL